MIKQWVIGGTSSAGTPVLLNCMVKTPNKNYKAEKVIYDIKGIDEETFTMFRKIARDILNDYVV